MIAEAYRLPLALARWQHGDWIEQTVRNREALANPAALELFRDLPALAME